MANKLLKFFSYSHLPDNLQAISRPFCNLATHIDNLIPESAEKTVCLRKLLESKDAGVRACLERDENVVIKPIVEKRDNYNYGASSDNEEG